MKVKDYEYGQVIYDTLFRVFYKQGNIKSTDMLKQYDDIAEILAHFQYVLDESIECE